MIEVVIIKKERSGTKMTSKIKEFPDYDKARDFVNKFNKEEDKGIPLFCEYATIVVKY